MERATLLFGCYRRGDANDPDVYVTAVTAVLSRYSADIVRTVTDPYSGLPSLKKQNGYTGMPDVADVKDACEAEAARTERMQRYAALPRLEFKRLPRPEAPPGAWANVLVTLDAPQYQRMCEVAATSDKRKWRKDENGRGIWVSWDLLDKPRPAAAAKEGFQPYTAEELIERYKPKPAGEVAA